MPNAFVLMTALPPTTGHADLIRFATEFMFNKDMNEANYRKRSIVHVIVCTQPSEPFADERAIAIGEHFADEHFVHVENLHREIEQNPEAPGFWDMWRDIMHEYGFVAGDYIFASESYGERLAAEVGGVFFPYDLDRQINHVKATAVRRSPTVAWKGILPEFRQYVTPRITVFGAESCGKTTTTKALAHSFAGQSLFEWARPYLETVGPEVTDKKMLDIFFGQAAIQREAKYNPKRPVVFQDTDLYSTIGYWEMWSPETVPNLLYGSALTFKSDLYLIMSSDIPFEADPLRYGGDKRETPDSYWIDLCKRFNLPYVYVTGKDYIDRMEQCNEAVAGAIRKKGLPLSSYERKFNV